MTGNAVESYARRLAPLMIAAWSLTSLFQKPVAADAPRKEHVRDTPRMHQARNTHILPTQFYVRNNNTDRVQAVADNIMQYRDNSRLLRLDTTAVGFFVASDLPLTPDQQDNIMPVFWSYRPMIPLIVGERSGDDLIDIDSALNLASKRGARWLRIDAPVPRSLASKYRHDFADDAFLCVNVKKLTELRNIVRQKQDALNIPATVNFYLSWNSYGNAEARRSPFLNMSSSVEEGRMRYKNTKAAIDLGVDNLAQPMAQLDFVVGHEMGHLYLELTDKGRKRLGACKYKADREHVADSIGASFAQNKLDAIMHGLGFMASPRSEIADDDAKKIADNLRDTLQEQHDKRLFYYETMTHPSHVARYMFMCDMADLKDSDIRDHLRDQYTRNLMRARPD
jgi:hypothetical protein